MSDNVNTLHDHIESAVQAIASNAELCAFAEERFGAPLLVCAGSSFGTDRELGVSHAPFVYIIPGDSDASLELYREGLPQPRAFDLRIVTGVLMCPAAPGVLDPVPPIPTADKRTAPIVYAAGHGDKGERLHLDVVKTIVELFREYGTHATAATCAYSGSTRFPLELFDSTISLEQPRTVNTGAY